ncbi:MAG: hypothetical protein ACK4ZN_05610 [Oceanibaculum sp.]
MAKSFLPLALAGILVSLFLAPVAPAQTDRSKLIYELMEQRQSRGQSRDPSLDPARPDNIERLPERPALPDTLRPPEGPRAPLLRPGAPDPTAPRSPLLESDRRQQEQREFQERLDRRDRFERQRLLMER